MKIRWGNVDPGGRMTVALFPFGPLLLGHGLIIGLEGKIIGVIDVSRQVGPMFIDAHELEHLYRYVGVVKGTIAD